MKRAHTTMLGLWGAAAFGAALALDLPDPTRPPFSPPVGGAGNMGSNGTAGANPGAAMPTAPGHAAGGVAPGTGTPDAGKANEGTAQTGRLSAVLLADAPGRNAAVIDGQVRHVGDRLPDGVVTAISSGGVTIKGTARTFVLGLYNREPEPEPAAASAPVPAKDATAPHPIDPPPSGASAPGKEQP